MASTYTTSLKIQKIGNGEQSGFWGTTTNTNWELIEQAVSGVQAITMANANYTLTDLNGISDEARNAVLVVSGTNSAVRQIIAPLVSKVYTIHNNTTGGYAITIGGSTGAVVSIPNGITTQVYCNGTDFYSAVTGSAGNFTVNGTFTASGNATVSGNLTVATNASVSGNATVTGNTTITGNLLVSNVATFTNTISGNISGNALTANTAKGIYNVGGWSVTANSTKLYFNYNGTDVGSLDSSGNFLVIGNVTAYATSV